MDEYEQLQRLRELWSRAIMIWGQILIPLGAAIIAFFISQLPNVIDRGWGTAFLIIGWVLSSFCLVFWRFMVLHIDKGIVKLYSRMLELEKENDMETQAAYYYRHLNTASINYLANRLGINCSELKNRDFRDFKRKIAQKGDPRDFLLEVWDRFLHKSVTIRGHWIPNLAVAAFIVGFFMVIIVGSKLCWFN